MTKEQIVAQALLDMTHRELWALCGTLAGAAQAYVEDGNILDAECFANYLLDWADDVDQSVDPA